MCTRVNVKSATSIAADIAIAAAVSFFVLTGALHASEPETRAASLHGTIIDGSTGEPIANAVVRLRESGRRDFSHADGSFHFDGIPAGTHTISVEMLGYAPLQHQVDVGEGRVMELVLTLTPSALRL
jgi:iron complex outermembrane receptor protein